MAKLGHLAVVAAVCGFVGWGVLGGGALPERIIARAAEVAATEKPPLPVMTAAEGARPRPAEGPERREALVLSATRSARAPIATGGKAGTSIGATEVTVERFRACVHAGACAAGAFLTEAGTACNWGAEGREAHPMNCVDFTGASAFCAFDGGRLCKPSEWFAACRGPLDCDYPYGAAYDRDACLARPGPPSSASGTEPAGSRASCRGGAPGVYDMAGNVSEWVDDCKESYCHFYGGAYITNEPVDTFASCKSVCAGNQKTLKSPTVGIRCCYDAAKPG